jgi:DNA-binding transcriptional ArsR family regulator/YHS domain-containing protein
MYNKIFKIQEDIFKALANSRRIEIVNLLRQEPLTVGEIYAMLDLPQANVSQHLQVLRKNGILKIDKKGKRVFYTIAHPEYIKVIDLVRDTLIKKSADKDLIKEFNTNIQDLVPLTHDPVCQMRLSSKTASYSHKYQGQTHYFCASGCYKNFKKEPEKYV